VFRLTRQEQTAVMVLSVLIVLGVIGLWLL